MISWHRVGQKVTPVDGPAFHEPIRSFPSGRLDIGHIPVPNQQMIYTVEEIGYGGTGVCFRLEEISGPYWYQAKWFRPVYPTIIDQLRNLDAPVPSETGKPVCVKEGEHA